MRYSTDSSIALILYIGILPLCFVVLYARCLTVSTLSTCTSQWHIFCHWHVSSAVALSAVNKTLLEWFLWQRWCNSFSHFSMALVWVSESYSMAAYTSTLLWCDVAIQWLSLRSAMSLFLCSYWYSSWDLHAAQLRQMQSRCRII
jgi:hypothetical protein